MSLSSNEEKKLQKGMIITDDISHFPILDFEDYVKALTNIIKNSYPKFSVGIYGEWGTGKTTLMRAIYNKLKENNEQNSIIPVWFNAWRYEREEQFAIIPLLKTIAYDIPEEEEFKDLKQKIKKGGINFLKKIPDIIPSIAAHYFGEDAKNITKEAVDQFKQQFIPKMELLAEVDKETIYFDGLENIQKELIKIREKNNLFKIVVFVDDLDRCSPDKALQVLESMKVFLDIDGFIYVIGLSFNKISQLITAYYKDKYKDIGIEGEQYLKKIIQIPIVLSDWNSDDIKILIKDFLTRNIIENQHYQKIIEENIDLISTGLEENPRETKRFLNNFIVAQEIFSKKGTRPKELLVLQILNMRWNELYRLIVNSSGKYLEELKRYIDDKEELRKLAVTKTEDTDLNPEMRILQKLRADENFWEFLGKNYDTIKNITDWHLYRRASRIGEESSIIVAEAIKKLKELLKKGAIPEYNEMRIRLGIHNLDLSGLKLGATNLAGADFHDANLQDAMLEGANLSGASLASANLSRASLNWAKFNGAQLSEADLTEAKLYTTDLSEVDLGGADLRGADLRGADLRGASLTEVDLRGADLSKAVLEGAFMRGVKFNGADLTGANLTDSIIQNVTDFANLEVGNAKFKDAVIDDHAFIDYLQGKMNKPNKPENIPEKIKDKRELRRRLEHIKTVSDENITFFMGESKLPD